MLNPRFFFLSLVFFAIGVESFAQKLYWAEQSNGRIQIADLSPTGVTNTATLLNFPNVLFVTLDPGQNFIYYSDEPSIQRANLANGSGQVEIINKFVMSGYSDISYSANAGGLFATGIGGDEGAYFVTEGGVESSFSGIGSGFSWLGVDADDGNELVYYVNTGDNAIYQTDFSGNVISTVVSLPFATSIDYLALDERTNILYFSAYSSPNYRIYSYNVTTAALTQLISTDANQITSIQPYSQFGKIYYAKDNSGIYSMNLDGTGSTLIVSGTGIRDIAVLADVTPPIFTALNPADNGSSVGISNNLTLTFDENVKVATLAGTSAETSFRLYKTTGNVLVETFDRSSANVSISNNIVTINPTAALEYNTDYYILAGAKTISDLSGNNWIGISLTTGWNFTSEPNTDIFYSRQSGTWDDINTWSHVSHTGPIATRAASGTGHQAFIGGSDVVTFSGSSFVWDLTIEPGSTLDANNFEMDLNGNLTINGSFLNGGDLVSTMGFTINSSVGMPIFNKWSLGGGFAGATYNLNTDVVALGGVTVIDGTIVPNGNTVYEPPTNISFTTGTTSTDTSIKLDWTRGNGTGVLVVMRIEGPSEVKPQFGAAYTANSVFGSGAQTGPDNFVVYNGTGTTVTVTGLTPSTQYYFSLYEYNDNVPTYGEIYNTYNYQVTPAATCATLAAPLNPQNAQYCLGQPTPALIVDDPGSGFSISWWDQTGTTPASGTSSGTNNESFTPDAPGTYAAKRVETATGCVSSSFVVATLTQHPSLVPGTAASNQTVCAGGDPVMITGGTPTGGDGNYTYQWFSASAPGGPFNTIIGETSANYDPPTGIAATTYYRRSVTAYCSIDGNVITVTVTPMPSVTTHPVNQSICDPNTAAFTAAATGSSLTYQWQIDNGGGFTDISNGGVYSGAATNTLSISSVTGLNGAQYRVVVMSAGACPVNSNAATLTVNPRPGAINQPQTLCENTPGGGTATIDLTTLNNGVTGGAANTTVSWFTNAALTTPVSSPSSASAANGTTFNARVTNTVTSCTNSATAVITVNAKPSVSTTPKTICSGTATAITFTSTPAGATYSWTFTPNANITGAANGSGSGINQTLTNNSATQQTITYNVTPTLGTCAGNLFTQTVSVDPVLTAFNVTGGGTFCEGESGINVGLSGSQTGVTYELFRGATTTGFTHNGDGSSFNFPLVAQAGTYTVKARTTLGCSRDMSGSATVSIKMFPSGPGSISGGLQLCIGQTSTYTISSVIGAESYTWTLPAGLETDGQDTDNSIQVFAEGGTGGVIKVVPQNSCGFGQTFTFTVGIIPSPQVEIVLPQEAFAGEQVAFGFKSEASVQKWSWDFGNSETSSEATPMTTYPVGGNFEVTLAVTDLTGCTGTDVKTLEVKPKAALSDIAIKNVITANGDGANDYLFIENIDKFPDNEVIVVDRWGTEVYRKKGYQNGDWDARNGDKYLPSGNYICVVNFGGKTFSRTITIIKEQ